jgi:hypothetical protein
MNGSLNTVRALLVVAVCAVGVMGVESASAASSKQPSGNYTGRAVHPLFFGLTDVDPYDTPLVLMVGKGQLTGISVRVRMECPDTRVWDLAYDRLVLPKKQRPKLSKTGGFHFSKNGIHVSGRIGRHVAEGSISARGHGCSVGNVTWTARKVTRFLI